MATFWVSTAGTDTASGTNFSVAKKTIAGAEAAANAPCTINVVNDGTYAGAATGAPFNSAYNGTNWDTNPGAHIRGCDSAGVSALATVAFTASAKQLIVIDDLARFIWVEGLRLDYTALRGTTASAMNAIIIDGNPYERRINDCECFLTTNIGSTVDLTTNTSVPELPYLSGSSVAHGGVVEVYNNILINAQMHFGGWSAGTAKYHNNIVMFGGIDVPGTRRPVNMVGGWATTDQQFYHNTLIHIAYGTERPDSAAIDQVATLNTSNLLALHSNLIYVETGTGVTAFANYLVEGTAGSAQAVASGTIGYNHIAIGPNLEAEASGANDWDTSTTTGIFEYQFNKGWRAGGGSGAGTNLNDNDVFNRTASLTSVFNDAVASYTWTPGDYDHDLLRDLRPLVGRTGAVGGGVVGAISGVINNPPVVIAHTYTGTSGVLKTTSATDGVLAGSSDPDLDTLTATVVADVSHGSLTLNTTDGSFDYTPNVTYTGTDTFTFKAWDGVTFSNVSTATLNISNQTPTGVSRTYRTDENITISVSASQGMLVGAADADVGQTLSITSVVAPSSGTLVSYNITTGSFVYRPDPFFSGGDSFTFKVTDGGLLTDALTATIVVFPSSSAVVTNLIDTAPFFRPSLYVETEIRTRWKKNRKKALNEANYTDGQVWNESTSRSIILTPAATTTVTLGGVATAQYLFLETDYPIEVSIDGTDKYWPVSKALAVALTSYSAISLKSVSTTNAQVILTVVD